MATELELDYRLRWLDFDKHGRIQPVAIIDMCQDVATVQAESMGIGRDDMMQQGVFWAIVRTKYEVVRQPRHFQVVKVRTWPHTPTSFSFLRDFRLTDTDGNVLVNATSEWVLMDFESRKFAKLKGRYDDSLVLCEERTFPEKPRKIPSFEEGNRPVHTVVPAYSDIDLNGHVNNARYLTYVVDALDLQEDQAIRSLQIDYRHEVLPGAPLEVHALVEGGTANLKGVREDGVTAFACALELG